MALCDEFITSFKFQDTTNLRVPSIKFRLFDLNFEMTLHDWSVRLELYKMEDILSGEVEKYEMGIPGKKVRCDLHKTWRSVSVYLISRIMQERKVHLGWWLAHNLKVISNTPSQQLTLGHIIGKLVLGNFDFASPATLSIYAKSPPPFTLDLKCLKRAGVIREGGRSYSFYKPGEAPKDVKLGAEESGKKKKAIERKLSNLEGLADKIEKVEKMIVDLRKS